jgi:hypothetical protein
MERMLAVMADQPAATAAGFFATACFAAWPLFRTPRMMRAIYIGNNLGFALHCALLGHWTAVAMNGFMSAQTIVTIMLDRPPRLRWVYYALMPLLTFANVVTWQGPPSFLAAADAKARLAGFEPCLGETFRLQGELDGKLEQLAEIEVGRASTEGIVNGDRSSIESI